MNTKIFVLTILFIFNIISTKKILNQINCAPVPTVKTYGIKPSVNVLPLSVSTIPSFKSSGHGIGSLSYQKSSGYLKGSLNSDNSYLTSSGYGFSKRIPYYGKISQTGYGSTLANSYPSYGNEYSNGKISQTGYGSTLAYPNSYPSYRNEYSNGKSSQTGYKSYGVNNKGSFGYNTKNMYGQRSYWDY